MRRVVILGCSGAGKSTFARKLGARIGAPVVHMDTLFWEPGWVEAENTVFRARVSAAITGDAWITDGNYIRRTFDLRLPRADAAIFIHQPRLLLMWRVIWRWWTHRGQNRSDMGAGCTEKIDGPFIQYFWTFERKTWPRIEEAMAKLAPHLSLVRLNGDAEVAAFLAALP